MGLFEQRDLLSHWSPLLRRSEHRRGGARLSVALMSVRWAWWLAVVDADWERRDVNWTTGVVYPSFVWRDCLSRSMQRVFSAAFECLLAIRDVYGEARLKRRAVLDCVGSAACLSRLCRADDGSKISCPSRSCSAPDFVGEGRSVLRHDGTSRWCLSFRIESRSTSRFLLRWLMFECELISWYYYCSSSVFASFAGLRSRLAS